MKPEMLSDKLPLPAGKVAACPVALYRVCLILIVVCLTACNRPYYKNDFEENTPTSGKLRIFYDEGLELHLQNQAHAFSTSYPNASIELRGVSESRAIEALYEDSCKAILIERLLSEKEKKTFASKNLFPKYSSVAKTGVALITNVNTDLTYLQLSQIRQLLTTPYHVSEDTLHQKETFRVLFDKENSSLEHYLKDSLLQGEKFSRNCSVLGSSIESINYVASHKNSIAFIDFAWLSDVDDSIYKANSTKIKFIGIGDKSAYEYPSQSSFKLGNYPLTRTVYLIRRSGDFTLAKGFESYVAGPKGQMTFLKQGLLPTRQQERIIQVNTAPLPAE